MFGRALLLAMTLAIVPATATSDPTAARLPIGDQAIAVGGSYACARSHGDQLACWGRGPDGEHLTAEVVRGITGVAGVALSWHRMVVRTRAGEVWQRVQGGALTKLALTGITEIAADDEAACARSAAGEVHCWVGSEPPRAALTGATQIAVAEHDACAIVGSDVRCWTVGATRAPVIVHRAAGASVLAGRGRGTRGSVFAAALAGGRLVVWAQTGDDGQWRDTGKPLPVPPNLPAGITGVAVGHMDVCVTAPTSVICWDDHTKPIARRYDALAGALVISIDSTGCAAMPDRSVRCWGWPGDVGDGQPSRHDAPIEVAGVTDAVAIDGTSETTCIKRAAGAIACWGTRLTENRGGRTNGIDLTPSELPKHYCARNRDDLGCELTHPKQPPTVETWSGGWYRGSYECKRRGKGKPITCQESWSAHGESQVTEGVFAEELVDAAALWLPINQESSLLCVTHTAGDIACEDVAMGLNRLTPIPEAQGALSLIAGPSITEHGPAALCALTRAGSVPCWDFSAGDAPHVVFVPGLTDVVGLAGGNLHACALRKSGRVACWGTTTFLGPGGRATVDTPVVVSGVSL